MTSSLTDFVRAIRAEAEDIKKKNTDSRVSPNSIFAEAIHKTLIEIKNGANSGEFADLVVINFIIQAAKEGYSSQEIKTFADEFTDKHDMDYSSDLEAEALPPNDSGESSAPAEATGLPELT